MARQHEIAIGAETGAFEKGVKSGIIDPLDDAEGALKRLGQSTAPHKLEQTMRDAQQETKDLAAETRRTADAIESEFRQSYKRAGDAAEGFRRDAGGNVQSFKEEAVQNLSEVASSFTGDMSQMADGVQGLTGGLASSLTPGIGIPVAILGAAAAAFFAEWQKNAEATKQLVSDMYDDMEQSGNDFLSADFIQQGIGKVYKEQFDEVKQHSREMGADSHDVAQAMAGDVGMVTQLLDAQNAKRDEEIDRIRKSGDSLDVQQNRIDGVNAKYSAQNQWLVNIARANADATAKAKELNDTIDRMTTLKYVDIVVNGNFSDFNRKFAQAQQQAARGITIGTAFKGAVWQ